MKGFSILIIVPTFNSYKLLKPLIKSLEMQSFKNWRLLFVDGNSEQKHIDYLNKISQINEKIFWIKQENKFKGIYGAMNQGILFARESDWVMFWGSDDRAANINSLKYISEAFEITRTKKPYLIFSKCKYFDLVKLEKKRDSFFLNNKSNKFINWRYFATLLFLGASPPHQGTVFSPESLENKKIYDENYNIAADLKYFLEMSFSKKTTIFCMSEVTILIGSGGISSLHIKSKIKQVLKAYFRRFHIFFIIPFIFRYSRKTKSFIGL